MRVKNSTRYRTDNLRRFLLRGAKAEGVAPLRVELIPAHGPRVNGVAWSAAREIRLSLPRALEPRGRELAQVYVHELGHLRGLDHKDMVDWWLVEVPWAEGLVIREKPKPRRRPRDVRAERAAHAQAKLAEHLKKLKREQALARKWRRKVRYYSKALAARKAACPRLKES